MQNYNQSRSSDKVIFGGTLIIVRFEKKSIVSLTNLQWNKIKITTMSLEIKNTQKARNKN